MASKDLVHKCVYCDSPLFHNSLSDVRVSSLPTIVMSSYAIIAKYESNLMKEWILYLENTIR